MDHFTYKNSDLYAEDIKLNDIADEVGTPVYVYSTATIKHHVNVFREALKNSDHKIFYSVKANSNQAVLSILAKLNVGMDVVSLGEYERARAAGVKAEDIVFSGVGKTDHELRETLSNGIYQYNIESENELYALNDIAISLNKKAPISFRINPDVDAKTHAKISTGKKGDKFGIAYKDARDLYKKASSLAGVEIVGIDAHIGSQITELTPFADSFNKIKTMLDILRSDGHKIERVDLGGGLGIPYTQSNQNPPLPFEYGELIHKVFGDKDVEIGIEPGRLVMGNAGVLVSEVIYSKSTDGENFLIVDAAMNDLVRPAMYNAHHDIVPVTQSNRAQKNFNVVGPICESGDQFAKDLSLTELEKGERIAFRSAGAYGAVMSSEYNSRPLVPEVLVDKNQFAIIRKRPSIQDMIDRDIVPDWV